MKSVTFVFFHGAVGLVPNFAPGQTPSCVSPVDCGSPLETASKTELQKPLARPVASVVEEDWNAGAALKSARDWTDDQGRQITAKFVSAKGDSVILEREGRNFHWPLERLSEKDQAFVGKALAIALAPVDIGGGLAMDFVWIEDLGIWVGQYEVTNEEFRRFRPEHDSGYMTRNNRRFDLNEDRQPVTMVSYEDAVAFVEWLNAQCPLGGSGRRARLLTGDEWTAIARCGIDRDFPWGDSWPPERGNYNDETAREKLSFGGIKGYDDGFAVAAPVERSGRNEWNLYGVGGNVFEWTSELRGSNRVIRGGNWGTSNADRHLAIESRSERDPSQRGRAWGFRVAISPESQ